ncbi:retrovirus-related Pol polyprotein from [Elysia marginata]|uniref:Retrovirus-related Pol polyprotein from n=1 Tax=Elysia marginata TaxID=1093978 RepID=A0AAV4GE71_9GAST|nr:retrovirus-related Pol polyprotein from [Elysia marginata]
MQLRKKVVTYMGRKIRPEESPSHTCQHLKTRDTEKSRNFKLPDSLYTKYVNSNSILEKPTEKEWNHQQEKALRDMSLSADAVLKLYNSNQPLKIQCDASSTGLGASLMQDGQPVAYVSRVLTECEKR